MRLVNYLLVTIAIALLSSGCSKPEEKSTVAEIITGNYGGNLELSVMGSSQGSLQTQVQIIQMEESSVKVILKGNPDAEGAMAIKGDIEIKDVPVSENSGTYILEETGIDTMVGSTKYKGSVKGKVSGNDIDLTFSLIPGAMPMPVTAVFKGKK